MLTESQDGRIVRYRIHEDFSEVQDSPQGGEDISKVKYGMISNDVQSPAASLNFTPSIIDGLRFAPGQTIQESNADGKVDEEIVVDKQHVDEAHSSLRHRYKENYQNPEPKGDSGVANDDFDIAEPSNDLETPQVPNVEVGNNGANNDDSINFDVRA
ncbi:uncharacterized protein LOC113303092 isoform X1 [Papaver somniferum]|uniref:uncharacterized protein LOC113303092 isoform X1 n=1 Tax=Papaver somniferum TaxID=3469 RepID=UPI000E6F62FE|nr:uncharacterized protein LOC113303092 isoform X1 [Papaver somniferum]